MNAGGLTLSLFGIVLIFLIINAILLWLFLKKKQDGRDDQSLVMLQSQLQELNRTIDTKIGESTKQVHESVRAQLGVVKEETGRLTKLDETDRQVVSFADQLQSLQDILQNPKQRGVLGEYFLETVLQDVLPVGTYKTQYEFKNGEKVDAVVIVKDQLVPVDAKFSLENYNRMVEQRDQNERQRLEKVFVNDLKLRIKESSKYIRPEENTTDFVFMFIPSEGIYYDLLSNKVGFIQGEESNLIQRAYKEYKVIIVSPTTFMAYLQTVLQGLKSLKIEEQAQQIIKKVGQLRSHLERYGEYHKRLGNALGTTISHYNASNKQFDLIDKDVYRLTDKRTNVEVGMLEGPEKGES